MQTASTAVSSPISTSASMVLGFEHLDAIQDAKSNGVLESVLAIIALMSVKLIRPRGKALLDDRFDDGLGDLSAKLNIFCHFAPYGQIGGIDGISEPQFRTALLIYAELATTHLAIAELEYAVYAIRLQSRKEAIKCIIRQMTKNHSCVFVARASGATTDIKGEYAIIPPTSTCYDSSMFVAQTLTSHQDGKRYAVSATAITAEHLDDPEIAANLAALNLRPTSASLTESGEQWLAMYDLTLLSGINTSLSLDSGESKNNSLWLVEALMKLLNTAWDWSRDFKTQSELRRFGQVFVETRKVIFALLELEQTFGINIIDNESLREVVTRALNGAGKISEIPKTATIAVPVDEERLANLMFLSEEKAQLPSGLDYSQEKYQKKLAELNQAMEQGRIMRNISPEHLVIKADGTSIMPKMLNGNLVIPLVMEGDLVLDTRSKTVLKQALPNATQKQLEVVARVEENEGLTPGTYGLHPEKLLQFEAAVAEVNAKLAEQGISFTLQINQVSRALTLPGLVILAGATPVLALARRLTPNNGNPSQWREMHGENEKANRLFESTLPCGYKLKLVAILNVMTPEVYVFLSK